MAKQKINKNAGKEELEALLFAGEGNLDTEGLLTFVKRTQPNDVHQRKIARAAELFKAL